MAKISEYIFILASSNYNFIEYVTDWFQKYLNMLTMLSATVIESWTVKGFSIQQPVLIVKVIKKKLSCAKKNNYGGALAYLLGACLPVAVAFSFPSWRLRVEVSSQLLSTIVLQKNNCGADDI